jgi:hypothetical protein
VARGRSLSAVLKKAAINLRIMAALFWACVTPERRFKTLRLMIALARGIPGARVTLGAPPASPAPFAVWGQESPKRSGRPFSPVPHRKGTFPGSRHASGVGAPSRAGQRRRRRPVPGRKIWQSNEFVIEFCELSGPLMQPIVQTVMHP